nr:MAG TPA: hypothetical protein [Caudoviricetes sp.]
MNQRSTGLLVILIMTLLEILFNFTNMMESVI